MAFSSDSVQVQVAYSALERLKSQLETCRWDIWTKEMRTSLNVLHFFSPKPKLEPLVHSSLVTSVKKFEEEFRFAATFVDYIHTWTDASKVEKKLESLVFKIEDAMLEIGKGLENACSRKYIIACPSKLIDLVSNFLEKIEVLKSEIREVYSYLSIHSFQSLSPLYSYYPWKMVVRSISDNLQVLSKNLSHTDPLTAKIRIIKDHLSSFVCFVEDAFNYDPSCLPDDPKIKDLLIDVGDAAIQMAHLSFLCWIKGIDSNTAKEIIVILSDLQKKIDPASPEFLEMNLRFLEAVRSRTRADIFVKYLLSGTKVDGLYEDLKFLVDIVTNKKHLFREEAQSTLADVKSDIAVFNYMSARERGRDIVLFTLFAKIWLIRAEIFLTKQINGATIVPSAEINVLNGRLILLRTKFENIPLEEVTENCKQTLLLIEAVDKAIASLCGSFCAGEITRSNFLDVFELRLNILLFKAESFLVELLNSNASFTVQVKDGIETLLAEIKLFRSLVPEPEENTEKWKRFFTRIDSVAKGVNSLYYKFLAKEITEEMVTEMNLQLSHLFDKIKLVNEELNKIYLEVPRTMFPKINGLGFMNLLSRKLRELLNKSPCSIASVKHHIEAISEELVFLTSFLKDVEDQDIEHKKLKEVGTSVIGVTYAAEYVIDSIVVGTGATWHDILHLCCLLEEIKLTNIQVREVYEKDTHTVVRSVAQASRHEISQASTRQNDEDVVDLHDQEDAIIDQLTRGSLQRDLVAIVGMPGIGKTTMANKVFNDPKVTYHFHIRAWCRVSQAYVKRDLLLGILINISGPTADILQMTDQDLELELYHKLKQKRYLVVMDDMWNTGAWDDLERSLPNDGNGSRILMTSRLHDVAVKAKPDSKPYPLRLLSDSESWNLLRRKIFHEENCPEELLEIGTQISRSCRGLPLAIVAIAGLLERADRTQNWWEKIAQSISSHIVDDPEIQCKVVLELSYKHLPDYLKACFLYFGSFHQNKDVLVKRLIWLWIGEGFVQKREEKSLEDIAEYYLRDLIGRSLVMVAKRRSNGGVKACCVHDILHDLCQSKSKEENFSRIITRYDEPHSSFDDLDYGVGFDYYDHLHSTRYDDHRLCILTKRKHFVMSRPSGAYARSLLFFATSDMYPRCPYDVSFIPHNFKLLWVLDLECINMGPSFLSGIELLVHLRYLSVSGDIDSVPSSISNLWNLEILIVKGLKGKVVLPDTIWFMAKLQHVHVSNYATFTLQDSELGKLFQLDNLVSLSSPSLSNGEEAAMIIRRLPNLRKFRCIFLEPKNCSENCNSFPSLDYLTQLESLKISYFGTAPNPSEFNLPLNLKKLTLSNFRLPWDLISAIGRLPNLEVLKLLCRAFEGEIWEMREEEFLKLKFLKLDTLNLVQWSASSDHLPNLQHLALRNCKQLEEVPSDFVEICTLQVIEVNGCGHSADELVARIEEEGIEGLNVLINYSDSNFR